MIDIVVYALAVDFNGATLSRTIAKEITVRGLHLGTSFSLPIEWSEPHERQYAKMAAQAKLPERYADMAGGLDLAKKLFNPVLSDAANILQWNHTKQSWENCRS